MIWLYSSPVLGTGIADADVWNTDQYGGGDYVAWSYIAAHPENQYILSSGHNITIDRSITVARLTNLAADGSDNGGQFATAVGDIDITADVSACSAMSCLMINHHGVVLTGVFTGGVPGNNSPYAWAVDCGDWQVVANPIVRGSLIQLAQSPAVFGMFNWQPAVGDYVQIGDTIIPVMAASNVLDGVSIGSGIGGGAPEQTGTVVLPTEAQVQQGVAFGAASALMGEYVGGGVLGMAANGFNRIEGGL